MYEIVGMENMLEWNDVSLAMFLLQDYYWFYCLRNFFFKCGQYHIQVWTDHSPTTDLHVQKEAWTFVHSQ